jgi:hypothetical protein
LSGAALVARFAVAAAPLFHLRLEYVAAALL